MEKKGLIDAKESAQEAAIRELHEETGYHGTIHSISPIMVNDPGMTSANMRLAVVNVNLDDPMNRNVIPKLDEGEYVETKIIEIKNLLQELEGIYKINNIYFLFLCFLSFFLLNKYTLSNLRNSSPSFIRIQ